MCTDETPCFDLFWVRDLEESSLELHMLKREENPDRQIMGKGCLSQKHTHLYLN